MKPSIVTVIFHIIRIIMFLCIAAGPSLCAGEGAIGPLDPSFLRMISHIRELDEFTTEQKNTFANDMTRIMLDLASHHPAPTGEVARWFADHMTAFINDQSKNRISFSEAMVMPVIDSIKAELTLEATIAYCRIEPSPEKREEVKSKLDLLRARIDRVIDKHAEERNRASLHAYIAEGLSIAASIYEQSVTDAHILDGYYLSLVNIDILLHEPGVDLACLSEVDYSDYDSATHAMARALNSALKDLAGSPFFSREDGKIIAALDQDNDVKLVAMMAAANKDRQRQRGVPNP